MKLKKRTALALVLTSGLSATAFSLPLLAADAAADAADTSDQPTAESELTEIVVTAEKRAENLQEVPVAVSAFTTESRDLIGIETLQDVTNYTPGVTFNQADDRITIRGITRSTNNLGIEPGIPIYVDGFYRTFNNLVEDSPLSASQVEIYRGPQGTLFGRNAIGGAVSYTSARPTNDLEGEVRATIGNYEERSFEGALGGPVNDWLRFRVYGADFVQNEGWYQSIVSHNNDMLGLRDDQEYQLQLEGNVGSGFDWWAKADHRQWDEGFGNQVNISPYNLNNSGCTAGPLSFGPAGAPDLVCPGVLGPNGTYSSFAGNTNAIKVPPLTPAVPGIGQNVTTAANPYIQQDDTPDRDTLTDWTYTLQLNWHLGFADVKYIGGYDNYVYSLATDFDGTDRASYTYTPITGLNPVLIQSQVVTLYQEDKHFFSNELNLVSSSEGPFQYVLGFYDYHEHYNQPVSIGTTLPQGQLLQPLTLTGGLAAPDPTGTPYAYNSADAGQSNAVFGQVDWSIVPEFKVEGGLRYTKDQKSSDEQIREIFWDPTFLGSKAPSFDITQLLVGDVGGNGKSQDGVNLTPTAQGYLTRHLDISSSALTGTAGVNWLPNKDTLVYLSYTRGYKEAGLNTGTLVTLPYVQPEHIDAYEAGWKETFFNRFQLNTSLFYYKYLGAQVPLTETSSIVPVAQFFNLNEDNYGAEFESTWAATDNLRFLLDYGYLHARFAGVHGLYANDFDVDPATGAAGNPEPIDGNRVPGSPDQKVSFNTIYTWRFSNGALSASGSYLWRSGSTSTVFNDPQLFAPSYGQADFRATWTSNSHYQIVGYIRNAFGVAGKDQIVGGEYVANGYGAGISNSLAWQLIPPRTYGIEARYRFGDNPR
jgi:iron complex outermembrane receptor protein